MEQQGSWYGTVAPDNDYRYNGKELNGDYGMDLYEYGFRWYDAAIGRFTGVDPIADEFAWVNTYNYAENEPVAHIDLHGLQKWPANFIFNSALSDFNQQLGSPAEKINSATSSISPKTKNRVQLVTGGLGNVTFGVLGTIGAVAAAPETGGASAVAIPFTLGEASIGFAQIADGLFGEADPNSSLHSTGSMSLPHSLDKKSNSLR
jgi:RHS repeat-associated protein